MDDAIGGLLHSDKEALPLWKMAAIQKRGWEECTESTDARVDVSPPIIEFEDNQMKKKKKDTGLEELLEVGKAITTTSGSSKTTSCNFLIANPFKKTLNVKVDTSTVRIFIFSPLIQFIHIFFYYQGCHASAL